MNDASPDGTLARFLTLSDAAEMLSVSLGVAYSLVRSGELPAIRIGTRGQWRIERDVLESFIEARYEETRRASLWNQSDFANVADLFGEDHIRTSRS
jgi:excisionase family DNA binding protein